MSLVAGGDAVAQATILACLPASTAIFAVFCQTLKPADILRVARSTQLTLLAAGYDPVTYRAVNASAIGPAVIPAVIHQTWKTADIPQQWQAARQSCIDMHPTFRFRLWTDEDARALIARDLPELLPTFDSYLFNIQRADAIR